MVGGGVEFAPLLTIRADVLANALELRKQRRGECHSVAAVIHELNSIRGANCKRTQTSDFHQTAINGAKFTQKKGNAANTRDKSSN
jgi:hypothetical protein